MTEPISETPSQLRRRNDVRTEDLLFTNGMSSTDDQPTIISRAALEAQPDDPSSVRGRQLAHFELIESIGVGGMAAVLRARDTQLDRFVALKILPPDLASDPENVRRFHQEARSAAKLDHENIARVFFCGEDQRLHFIAFEFVEGENLRTFLERRGRLPEVEAINYMIQVAAGLCHAAERGVVHRDIKPSNIIISPNGRAKLVDMGLARCLEPRTDKDLTQSGVTLGTFDYISPEQALEPREADARSDIYSLGCTFYHCLTGRPPVPEGTAAKKLHHHQHVKPQDPRILAPGISDEVALILDHMMAKNPADRYQTPSELIQHLLQGARRLGAAPALAEGTLSIEAPLPSAPSARPLLISALIAAIVVVLLLLIDPSGSTPDPKPLRPSKIPDHTPIAKNDKPDLKKEDSAKPEPVKDKDRATSEVSDKILTFDDEKRKFSELNDWLVKNNVAKDSQIEILLANDHLLTVTKDLDAGLRFAAKSVVVKAKYPAYKPTLRIRYVDRPTGELSIWSALAIESDACHIEGLRFIVDAESDAPLAALRLTGGRQTVDNCDFIQVNPREVPQMLASIVTDASGPGTRLFVKDSKFLAFERLAPDREAPAEKLELSGGGVRTNGTPVGKDAILLRGASRVQIDDCRVSVRTCLSSRSKDGANLSMTRV